VVVCFDLVSSGEEAVEWFDKCGADDVAIRSGAFGYFVDVEILE
jgi:hypothetical protein